MTQRQGGFDAFMILLLSKSEADYPVLQHKKQMPVERLTDDDSEHHYRASGLGHSSLQCSDNFSILEVDPKSFMATVAGHRRLATVVSAKLVCATAAAMGAWNRNTRRRVV